MRKDGVDLKATEEMVAGSEHGTMDWTALRIIVGLCPLCTFFLNGTTSELGSSMSVSGKQQQFKGVDRWPLPCFRYQPVKGWSVGQAVFESDKNTSGASCTVYSFALVNLGLRRSERQLTTRVWDSLVFQDVLDVRDSDLLFVSKAAKDPLLSFIETPPYGQFQFGPAHSFGYIDNDPTASLICPTPRKLSARKSAEKCMMRWVLAWDFLRRQISRKGWMSWFTPGAKAMERVWLDRAIIGFSVIFLVFTNITL